MTNNRRAISFPALTLDAAVQLCDLMARLDAKWEMHTPLYEPTFHTATVGGKVWRTEYDRATKVMLITARPE